MKIAFSTIGCPSWSWDDIFSTAKFLGMDGVELRGMEDDVDITRSGLFSPAHLDLTVQNLKNTVGISMLASGARLGVGDTAGAMQQAQAYIDLAQKLGVPYVRVLISEEPAPTEGENIEQCRNLYRKLCTYAEDKNVTPLIETNGELGRSVVMAEFMEQVDAPNSGVLWDIHHPYRYFEETPQETCANIGKWVKYVHVKDSAGDANHVEYRMMGYGTVPVLDMLRLLQECGFDGFVSLEWLKRWHPNLLEPGIVFSQYAQYIRYLFSQL